MNRRQFVSLSGATAARLAAGQPARGSAATPRRALMKLGTETGLSPERLQYLARFSVKNVCAGSKPAEGRLYLTVDETQRMRETAED